MVQTALPLILGGLQMLTSSGAASQSGDLASEEARQQQDLIKQQKQNQLDTLTKQGTAANFAQQANTKAQLGPVNAGFSNMLLTGTQGLSTKPGTSLGGKTVLGL